MLAYCLTKVTMGQPMWFATLGEAQTAGKSDPSLMLEIEVLLLDIQSDKAGIIALLNRDDSLSKVIRRWKFTARGGLKEILDVEGEDKDVSVQSVKITPAVAEPVYLPTEKDPYGIGPSELDPDPKVAPPGRDQAEYTQTRAEIDARDAKFARHRNVPKFEPEK